MYSSKQVSIIGQAGQGSSNAPLLGRLAVAETREPCAEYAEVSTTVKDSREFGCGVYQCRPRERQRNTDQREFFTHGHGQVMVHGYESTLRGI